MKICFIGKYPPIEGGVSTSTYWLAHGLAERGHHVHVVTNADEVEDDYRMHLVPSDRQMYALDFPSTGGRVRVFPTEALSGRMGHIPRHNPFVTKLAGLATQVIRSAGADVIYAHYFEPFGMAAHLAAQWTGAPWVVRHAGSDLDRLMRSPQLSTAYKEMICRASGVVTQPRLVARFVGMGVDPRHLFSAEPYVPPPQCFNEKAPPLDINSLPVLRGPTQPDGTRIAFDPTRPTIGIYGKVGMAKGSFDLLKALAILRDEHVAFNLLAMTQGMGLPAFNEAILQHGLGDRTWVIPFLPNWRVPSFIRTCTAVCFLERDFPIKIHGPVVAQEIQSAGGCLVLSGEIAGKQAARDKMIDGENVFIVEDPKVTADLAAALRTVIASPDTARRVGLAGTAFIDRTAFARFVESWEQIFLHAAGRPSTARSWALRDAEQRAEAATADADLSRLMPWLDVVLPTEAPRLRQQFRAGRAPDADQIREGLDFATFLGDALGPHGRLQTSAEIDTCLRFQTHRWLAQRDEAVTRQIPPFGEVDRLCGAQVSTPRARALRPLRSPHAAVVTFDHDVTPLFGSLRNGSNGSNGASNGTNGANGAAHGGTGIEQKETIVCFLRSPNLMRTELKLTPTIRDLLELCDGTRPLGALLDLTAERYRIDPNDRPAHDDSVVRALQQLYDQRVLVFCAHAPQ